MELPDGATVGQLLSIHRLLGASGATAASAKEDIAQIPTTAEMRPEIEIASLAILRTPVLGLYEFLRGATVTCRHVRSDYRHPRRVDVFTVSACDNSHNLTHIRPGDSTALVLE